MFEQAFVFWIYIFIGEDLKLTSHEVSVTSPLYGICINKKNGNCPERPLPWYWLNWFQQTLSILKGQEPIFRGAFLSSFLFCFFVCFLFVCLTIFFWFSTRIIKTAFLTFSFRFFFYPACSTLPPLLSRWLLSWWFSSTIHEKSWVSMLVYFLYRIGNICSKSSIKSKCWTYSEYTIKTWEQRQLTPLNVFIVNFSILCITLLLFVLLLWTRS